MIGLRRTEVTMMTTEPLPHCGKCGKSPWMHLLRGPWPYCNELGGTKASFSQAEVNVVRTTIGRKEILLVRKEESKGKKVIMESQDLG